MSRTFSPKWHRKRTAAAIADIYVDLLKLLDLDSSRDARKELATELDVHAGADGSAEENVALHKAIMQELAQNGGKVPDSIKA
jgi:hypothetical protein